MERTISIVAIVGLVAVLFSPTIGGFLMRATLCAITSTLWTYPEQARAFIFMYGEV